jgi:hypothetical protein
MGLRLPPVAQTLSFPERPHASAVQLVGSQITGYRALMITDCRKTITEAVKNIGGSPELSRIALKECHGAGGRFSARNR